MTGQVGEAFIEVHADSAGLTTEVKIAAKKASESAEVVIETKVDNKQLERAVQQGVSKRSIRSLSELNFSLAKVAAGAAIAVGSFTDYGAVLEGALAATVALGSALGEAGVAAFSAAGVVGSLGAAYGTYKIAAVGVEDALKSVTKVQDEIATSGEASEASLEAQAAAMKNLAPSAREFVRAVSGARGEFDTFRKGIQDVAFAGLGDTLSTLATTALPQLQDEFEGIAGTLNEAAIATGDWLSEGENIAQIENIMSGLNDILQDLIPGIGAVARGMLNLFEGILPSSDRLATSLTDIGRSFETWTEGVVASGELAETMDHAQDTAGDLVSILGNVGDILLTVFGAGTDTGQDLLGTIDDATESLAEFLHTAEGQAGLSDFFDSTSAAADALATAFDVLSPAAQGIFDALIILGPAFESLHEAVAPVAEVVSETLAVALTDLATAVSPVIELMANLIKAFPPELLGTLTAAAIGIKALSVAMTSLSGSATVGGIRTAGTAVGAFATDVKTANQMAAAGAPGIKTYAGNMKTLAGSIRGMGGAMKGISGAAGFGALALGAQESNKHLSALETIMGTTAIGFSVGGPWGAAIGAAAGIAIEFATATSKAEDRLKAFQDAAAAGGGQQTADTFKAAQVQAVALKDDLDALGISQDTFIAAQQGVPAAVAQVNAAYQEQTTTFEDLQNGTAQASGSFQDLIDANTNLAPANERVVSAMQGSNAAMEEAKAVADAAQRAYNKTAEGIEAMNDAALNSIDTGIAFRDSIRQANKAAREQEGQTKKGTAAYDALLGKMSGVGHQFDALSPKAQSSVGKMTSAANAVETVGDKMGFTNQQTEDMIRELGLVPDNVDVKFREDGSVKVVQSARDIKAAADAAEGTFTTIFHTIFSSSGNRVVGSGGHSVDAQGGIHTSPTTVRVGDRAPELVVPLDPKAQLRPGVEDALMTLASQRGGGGTGGPTQLHIHAPTDDPVALGFKVLDRLAVAGVL